MYGFERAFSMAWQALEVRQRGSNQTPSEISLEWRDRLITSMLYRYQKVSIPAKWTLPVDPKRKDTSQGSIGVPRPLPNTNQRPAETQTTKCWSNLLQALYYMCFFPTCPSSLAGVDVPVEPAKSHPLPSSLFLRLVLLRRVILSRSCFVNSF